MDQAPNIPLEAATDEPASPPTPSPPPPRPSVSTRLAESPVEPALGAGRDPRPGRADRHDGWTPERIRAFLDVLAECGSVSDAARAAGMTPQAAYRLRNRAAGGAFHLAWNAAEQLARRHLAGAVLSRALHGCVEVIVRDGKVWGERHRYDNRLTMAVLARLDRRAESDSDECRAARLVAREFDQFLDIVCAGGDGAADFIAAREALGDEGDTEAAAQHRRENFRRYGVGLPEEMDLGDLDPANRENWTAEQAERAERSGLLEAVAELEKERARDAEIQEALAGGWAFPMANGGILMWQRPTPPPFPPESAPAGEAQDEADKVRAPAAAESAVETPEAAAEAPAEEAAKAPEAKAEAPVRPASPPDGTAARRPASRRPRAKAPPPPAAAEPEPGDSPPAHPAPAAPPGAESTAANHPSAQPGPPDGPPPPGWVATD